ncbi:MULTISPECIES: LexA family protein [Pseudanabaena]|uniref:LexA family protein n=1 Tax=Pseudanabaena TaxID=1152 RepID=UPI00247A1760|nr:MULTISPECIES: translesion error-prone DNA polymerase V autoproteolytic subunit [Pseudanabaena]MEA5488786.1 translesion error-prone DNA polymerase V autoproteolytic subunit [Pseudanabaena sp. CCNP1317]WGS71258.1 translesion error-prone DNA polymerase V autoproteolytic subunit [Pseudanabaena galeata CCNP1313]
MESDDPHQSKFRQLKSSRHDPSALNIQLLTNKNVVNIGSWTKEQVSGLAESVRDIHLPDMSTKLELPLQNCSVPAGFPSPAEDYVEHRLDLNSYLVTHPAATFFVRASGNSMTGANIHDGDLLIVDRSIEAAHNDIVIAVVLGEITVKRLHYLRGEIALVPENESYQTIFINEHSDLHIWGVVTNAIHCVRPKSRKKIRPSRLQ